MKINDAIKSLIEKMKVQSLWDSPDLCNVLDEFNNNSHTPDYYTELLIGSVHAGEIRVIAKPLSGLWPRYYPNEIIVWAAKRKFELPSALLKKSSTDISARIVSEQELSKNMNLNNLVCLDKFESNVSSNVLDLGIQGKTTVYTLSTVANQFIRVMPVHLLHIKSNLPEQSVICFSPKDKIVYPHPAVQKGYIASGEAQAVGINSLWVDSKELEQHGNIYVSDKIIHDENISLKQQVTELKNNNISIHDENLTLRQQVEDLKSENDANPKSTNTLLKLLATAAYVAYSYNPVDAKSTIPKELSDDVKLTIDEQVLPQTVREWLKLACDKYPRLDKKS